jgi:hypothetical protein
MFVALAVIFLVTSLISGVEAFAPISETNDFERAPIVDVVLVEELNLEDDGAVRVSGRKNAPDGPAVVAALPSTETILVGAQVISKLRNSGIQRATHPTGPPATLA